jgi:hypothetical protein
MPLFNVGDFLRIGESYADIARGVINMDIP